MRFARSDCTYGITFGLLTVGLLVIAFRGGWQWLFVWPAISCAVLSVSYFLGSTVLFAKRSDGSRSWPATLVLGPYLIFAWIVWNVQILFSREPAWHRVNERLLVARRLWTRELPENVDVICDLTSELTDPADICTHPGYRCHPMLDAAGLPAEQLRKLAGSLCPAVGKSVLIHCANGHGRTGLIAAAWLLVTHQVESADDALTLLKAARPGIRLRGRQQQSLYDLEQTLRDESR